LVASDVSFDPSADSELDAEGYVNDIALERPLGAELFPFACGFSLRADCAKILAQTTGRIMA
jgi:hypothetical protein